MFLVRILNINKNMMKIFKLDTKIMHEILYTFCGAFFLVTSLVYIALLSARRVNISHRCCSRMSQYRVHAR